ncbi:hypothetical protein B0H17DRAFT_1181087 [Mycena rosella]|uniref:Uncharacterized protein n=1 Tax=Mycena rosella TaxID=1033263 RepID=A0AAD7GFP0_MYCRO|nr:hypothetical protein B0H17DRAFT_1181087 [Mycena rosella]
MVPLEHSYSRGFKAFQAELYFPINPRENILKRSPTPDKSGDSLSLTLQQYSPLQYPRTLPVTLRSHRKVSPGALSGLRRSPPVQTHLFFTVTPSATSTIQSYVQNGKAIVQVHVQYVAPISAGLRLAEEVKKLREELEAQRIADFRYALALRALTGKPIVSSPCGLGLIHAMALDDRLFYALDVKERDALLKHRIEDYKTFAEIRRLKTQWENKKAYARRYNEGPPHCHDWFLAIERPWSWEKEEGRVKPPDNRGACEFPDNPAPSRSDFLEYAEALGLPDDVRDDLAVREYWNGNGNLILNRECQRNFGGKWSYCGRTARFGPGTSVGTTYLAYFTGPVGINRVFSGPRLMDMVSSLQIPKIQAIGVVS